MSDTVITTYVEGESIFIDGKEYQLITTGRQQAIQVQGITRWASQYGNDLYELLQNTDETSDSSGIGMLIGLLEQLTADAMIDLFQAVSGCSKEEAELHFDAASLIEAGIVVYEKHPTVRRLLDRFFSTSDSEQEKQPESSTTSE